MNRKKLVSWSEMVGGYWDGRRFRVFAWVRRMVHQRVVMVKEAVEVCGVECEVESKRWMRSEYVDLGGVRWEEGRGWVRFFELSKVELVDPRSADKLDGVSYLELLRGGELGEVSAEDFLELEERDDVGGWVDDGDKAWWRDQRS